MENSRSKWWKNKRKENGSPEGKLEVNKENLKIKKRKERLGEKNEVNEKRQKN